MCADISWAAQSTLESEGMLYNECDDVVKQLKRGLQEPQTQAGSGCHFTDLLQHRLLLHQQHVLSQPLPSAAPQAPARKLRGRTIGADVDLSRPRRRELG